MSSDSISNLDSDSHQTIIKTDKPGEDDFSYAVKEGAVWRALFANLGIAAIKLACWFISRSSAMLSESIHSAADGFNSLCLLIGLKRGRRPADKGHPFGYGLEANIWALFACIFMFVGSGVAILSGGERLLVYPNGSLEIIEHYHLIAITLIGSMIFELWAVTGASRAVLAEAGDSAETRIQAYIKSIKYIRHIKSPTTKFVWYEDTVALAGVLIAFIAISISKFGVEEKFAHIPDSIASIIIGLMLLGLAIYLLKYNINFLTGASAKPDTEATIRSIADTTTGVSQVLDLKTMDMGSSGLIISMEIEVDPEIQVKDADDIADKLEAKLKEKLDNISHITIEVQASDAEDDWREKFEKLIEDGQKIEVFNKQEALMLKRFFDFTDTVVCEIMVPRTDVVFIDADATVDELIDTINSSGHTRIPIFEENVDNLIGVINAKDVLKVLRNCEDKKNLEIRDLARELPIVPENKSISSMLNYLKVNKSQIAAVVDEHGGMAGIVTVEDILEEIVGEIYDEYDIQIPDIIKLDGKTISVYSKMDIQDLNERFNLDLPTEEFQTLGGYIFGQLGREPEIGDEVVLGDLKMKVESMDGHKIVRAILSKEDEFKDIQED